MILSVMMDRGPDYRHQVKCNRSSYSTTPWKWISWRSFDLLHFLEVCCPAQMQTIFFCAMFFKFLLSCQIKLSLAYMIYDGGMTWGGETPQGTGNIDCQYFFVVLEEGLYLRHYLYFSPKYFSSSMLGSNSSLHSIYCESSVNKIPTLVVLQSIPRFKVRITLTEDSQNKDFLYTMMLVHLLVIVVCCLCTELCNGHPP